MANFIIFPQANSATVDTATAHDLDFSSYPLLEEIHCFRWDESTQNGQLEYCPCEEYRPNEDITDISNYEAVIEYVREALDAKVNPNLYYAIADGIQVGEGIYYLGDFLECTLCPRRTEPPAGFTDLKPGNASNQWQNLHWSGTSWVWSPFPLTLSLDEGKQYIIKLIRQQYSNHVNHQLRTYSVWELSQDTVLEHFIPADSEENGFQDMGAYEAALAQQRDLLISIINSTSSLNQLYSFDPTLNSPTNS